FKPNRIEASKKMALEFVENRPTDRIGLVIFAGESFTQCPLTTDQHILKEQLANVIKAIQSTRNVRSIQRVEALKLFGRFLKASNVDTCMVGDLNCLLK
ncbi:MAG: VWA domain-containing protein, partial [Bacteroidia bacterium]